MNLEDLLNDPCLWCPGDVDCETCPFFRMEERQKIQDGEADPVIFTEDLLRNEVVK